MRLLFSIPMALVGSLLGSALRSAMKIVEARLDAGPDAPAAEMDLNINGSALAALGGGFMGLLFGTRTAFWSGVALGAAGIDRFDLRLLRMAGVDVDAMIARARAMAEQAAQRSSGASSPEPTQEPAETARSNDAVEIPIESPSPEPA